MADNIRWRLQFSISERTDRQVREIAERIGAANTVETMKRALALLDVLSEVEHSGEGELYVHWANGEQERLPLR